MITRAAAGAVLGAVLASAALGAFARFSPTLLLDFDADLPRQVTSGFFPVERTPAETFAWTTSQATITLRGLDRTTPWRCVVRLSGSRPAAAPRGETTIAVDGITHATLRPADGYQDVEVELPRRSGSTGAAVTLATTPTFVPGASDTRALGVQIDRLACHRTEGGGWPASAPLAAAAVAGGAMGMVFALLAPTLAVALAGFAAFGAATAFALSVGAAAYAPDYLRRVAAVPLWIAGPVLLFCVARARAARPLHPAAGFVLAFSSALLCLKILALLHPSKEVVDAVFHAHRLGAVLAGNYYFTQPMPGGVQFPYAIGLYVAAAPWAGLMTDHVALLRIVVCLVDAIAGGLLYVVVASAWKDRFAGALAVVLYHAAPIPYTVIGNANLTYAFGQGIAAVAAVLAVLSAAGARHRRWGAALFLAAALAFLSHVGIFPLLAVMLLATGGLYLLLLEPSRRRHGAFIIGVTLVAAVFAVGAYYAHFPEVYKTLERVVTPAPDAPPDPGPAAANPGPELAMTDRALRAGALAGRSLGWPLLALAALGIGVVARAARDRLTLALAGWGVSAALFLAFRILAPVEMRYQRYADEFIERVCYATMPAVAILAGAAAAWCWRSGMLWRIGGAAAFVAAVAGAVRLWSGWIL